MALLHHRATGLWGLLTNLVRLAMHCGYVHLLQLDISDPTKIAHITATSSRDRRCMRYYTERLSKDDVKIFVWLAKASRVGHVPANPRRGQKLNHAVPYFPDAPLTLYYINVEDGFNFIQGMDANGNWVDTPFADFESTEFRLDEAITLEELMLFRAKYAEQMPIQSH